MQILGQQHVRLLKVDLLSKLHYNQIVTCSGVTVSVNIPAMTVPYKESLNIWLEGLSFTAGRRWVEWGTIKSDEQDCPALGQCEINASLAATKEQGNKDLEN